MATLQALKSQLTCMRALKNNTKGAQECSAQDKEAVANLVIQAGSSLFGNVTDLAQNYTLKLEQLSKQYPSLRLSQSDIRTLTNTADSEAFKNLLLSMPSRFVTSYASTLLQQQPIDDTLQTNPVNVSDAPISRSRSNAISKRFQKYDTSDRPTRQSRSSLAATKRPTADDLNMSRQRCMSDLSKHFWQQGRCSAQDKSDLIKGLIEEFKHDFHGDDDPAEFVFQFIQTLKDASRTTPEAKFSTKDIRPLQRAQHNWNDILFALMDDVPFKYTLLYEQFKDI